MQRATQSCKGIWACCLRPSSGWTWRRTHSQQWLPHARMRPHKLRSALVTRKHGLETETARNDLRVNTSRCNSSTDETNRADAQTAGARSGLWVSGNVDRRAGAAVSTQGALPTYHRHIIPLPGQYSMRCSNPTVVVGRLGGFAHPTFAEYRPNKLEACRHACRPGQSRARGRAAGSGRLHHDAARAH